MDSRKRSKTTDSVITTNNRFDVLSGDDFGDMEDEDDIEKSNETAKTTKVYIPPIVITEKFPYRAQIIKEINGITMTKNTNFVFNKYGLSIKANNKTDYYTLIKTKLETTNTQYYTHPLKEERNRHLVIKGLPIISVEEIQQELHKHKVKPIK